ARGSGQNPLPFGGTAGGDLPGRSQADQGGFKGPGAGGNAWPVDGFLRRRRGGGGRRDSKARFELSFEDPRRSHENTSSKTEAGRLAAARRIFAGTGLVLGRFEPASQRHSRE